MIAVLGVLGAVSGCASSSRLDSDASDASSLNIGSFTPTEHDAAVTLNCAFNANERLSDCRVVSERPEHMGYGALALAQVNKHEARPRRPQHPEQRIQFTLRFPG